MKRAIAFVFAAVFAASADTLTFGTPGEPVSGTREIAPGTVATGLEAHVVEGGTLVLTNGDVTLNAPAAGELPTISASGGALRVASDLAAPGGLRVAGRGEVIVREEFYPQAYNHSPTASLFAAGKNIDDFMPIDGKRISNMRELSNPKPGYPCCVRRSPGELTFEMQYKDDYLRSIKVRLFQDGPDIYAQVMWGRYASPSYGYGHSLEAPGSYINSTPIQSQTHQMTESHQVWFGVHTLALASLPRVDRAYTFAGGLDVSGRMFVDSSFMSIEGSGTLANDLAVPLSLSNSTLRVRRDVDTTLRSDIEAFNGTLSLGGTQGGSRVESGAIVTIGGAKTTLFYDALIEDLEITGAYVRQGTGSALIGDRSWFGYCEKNATEITFQAQGWSADGWNKCALVKIWQDGSNIVGQVTGKPYNAIGVSPLGTDMRIAANVKGQGDYNATNITYTMRVNASPVVHLAGTATNGAPMSVVVESNANVVVDSPQALPPARNGLVTVERGAVMRWACGNAQSGYMPTFCVRGRLFYLKAGYRDGSVYELDGGFMALYNLGENSSTTEAGQYLNNMTFRNGARLVGRRPRIGYSGACVWTVTGDSPSYWESGGRLVGDGNASKESGYSFTVNVADVTGDDDADFISTPAAASGFADSLFTDYNSSLMRLKVIKVGGGTWEWRAKGGTWTGRLMVNAGAVRFMKSGTLAANGLGVQLGGGELQLAAGTSNAIPKFVVAVDSSLRLGEGAVVDLPDVADDFAYGTAFTNGVALDIFGPHVRDGARTGVRFGTSACLGADLLSRVRYNDFYVTQDEEGYLRSASHGTMVIFR